MSITEPSDKGVAFIAAHEGKRSRWYLDPVGIPTIGYGFTWRSRSFRIWWRKNKPGEKFARGASMSDAEMFDALKTLIRDEYGAAVVSKIKPGKQHWYDGATSACFNMGPGSLDWKWGRALAEGNASRSAALLRNTGTTARGKRLRGLVRRRKEESRVIEHADYGTHGRKTFGSSTKAATPDDELRGYQKKLARLGFYKGEVDGLDGPKTKAAIEAFQAGHPDLINDGVLGPATMAQVDRAYAALEKAAAGGAASGGTAGGAVASGGETEGTPSDIPPPEFRPDIPPVESLPAFDLLTWLWIAAAVIAIGTIGWLVWKHRPEIIHAWNRLRARVVE